MTQEQEILHKSKELFFKLGIRSITMDDISKELGISKKTLYLFVDNKADLVSKTLIMHFTEEKRIVEELRKGAENAIDETVRIAKNSLKQFRVMNPSSIYDIKKYYPNGWKIFELFKTEYIYTFTKNNIIQGKKEGLYRPELNEDVVAKLYINAIDYIVNPHNFPPTHYHFIDLYKEFINYHLHGIVTKKGSQYLSNLQLEENE